MSKVFSYHGVRDQEKLESLIQTISDLGSWVGPACVVVSRDRNHPLFNCALTGSHRIAAMRKADISYDQEDDFIPLVALEEIFAEYSIDYDEWLEKESPSRDTDYMDMAWRALSYTALEAYGLQY